ncbi:MAG: glycosyltransferase family 9 protein, partial [Opitutales bacterium]
AMGDVAIATAIMEDVRQAFPDARIDLNVMPPYLGLFAEDERFERVFAVDLRGEDRGLVGIRKWLRKVKGGRYDLVVDLQNNDRSRLLFVLWRFTALRVPRFVGLRKCFPYHSGVTEDDESKPPLERLHLAMRVAGIEPLSPCPVFGIGEDRVAKIDGLLSELGLKGRDFVILCPGSQAGGHLKRWGAERYAALARRLMQDHGLRSVIVGGPDDLDECACVHELADSATVNLCGRTEVLDLVPLGMRAIAVVANDTGPAHVLAAADKPMVCICGPTDPVRVKPICSRVETLQAEVECRSCYLKECPNGHVCMEELTVDLVMAALDRLGVGG